MPEDQAELFRRAFATWSEGAFEQYAAEHWHPDMVLGAALTDG